MRRPLALALLVLAASAIAGCNNEPAPANPAGQPSTPTVRSQATQTGSAPATGSRPTSVSAAPTATSAPAAAATATSTRAAAGWSRIVASNEGPAARYDHTAVLDPERQQLVVFGGRGKSEAGGSTYGDTWLLDLGTRTWRQAQGPGPEARFGHGAVYDAANRRMIVAMGQGGPAGFFNDVWAFDLDKETWALLKASSNTPDAPRTRYGQSAVLDKRGRVLISHGFSDQGRFDDTWAFDPVTASWTDITPPSGPRPLKRCLHEMVYDAQFDMMFLYGGCSSGFGPCPQGDLWALDFDNNTWIDLKPGGDVPSPRSNPSLFYDPLLRRILLFGGKTESAPSAETWGYDLESNAWTALQPGAAPDPRSSQGTGYDPATGRAAIFGGQTAGGPSNEVWELRQ